MKILVDHIFEVPRDVFVEKIFFDHEFNVAVHEHMGFRSRTVLESREDEASRYLKIEFITNERLPWVAQKLFGQAEVGWVEEMHYDKAKWQAKITMRPHILADRVTTHGVMSFEALDAVTTRRTFAVDSSVAVPAVGRAIEKKMLSETRKNFDLMMTYTNHWIHDRGLATPLPRAASSRRG